tara:strand:+ start:441 stop:689 length:249 start_codon:yes stop_codon:yes gene_type:complete
MNTEHHWRITVADLGDTDNDMDRSIAPDIQKTLEKAGIKAIVDQDEMDASTVDVYTNETEYEVKKALEDNGIELEPSFRFAY